MSSVQVIILKVAENSREIDLRRIFSDPLFKVTELYRDTIPPGDYTGFTQEQIETAFFLNRALKLAKTESPNSHCIVIRDDSVSIINDSSFLATKIRKVLDQKYDICYLCKWMDSCQMFTYVSDRKEVPALVKTRSPHGIQALLFSPMGRDRVLGIEPMENGRIMRNTLDVDGVLNEECFSSNLRSLAFTPNLFEYDISNNARRNGDFFKRNECADFSTLSPNSGSGGNLYIFILIVVITFLIAWAIITLSSRWQRRPETKSHSSIAKSSPKIDSSPRGVVIG